MNKSARLADEIRKDFHKCFEHFRLKITAESILRIVNFLDVTFDLSNGKYNDNPLYINSQSNHSPCILRQLPASVNKRISLLSSDEQAFHEAAPTYQNALRHSNYDNKLSYTQEARAVTNTCNCRVKNHCPLGGQCMASSIVYKATVSTSNTSITKHYIGMTASTFKERYRNHVKSFQNKKYSNETELSKHIWDLKEKNKDFDTTWSILKQSLSYMRGTKRCDLCLDEKLFIMKADKQSL